MDPDPEARLDQRSYWNGPAGEQWIAQAARYERMHHHFGRALLDVLDAQPGEEILEIGSGTGALALHIAAQVAPSGRVLGLDLSAPMVGQARRRAASAGIDNVTFEPGDAQDHPLPTAGFDALVSQFGVMFFDDPPTAFANLASSLRPGGRLAFVAWQDLANNDWAMVPALAALRHVPPPQLDDTAQTRAFSLADPTTPPTSCAKPASPTST